MLRAICCTAICAAQQICWILRDADWIVRRFASIQCRSRINQRDPRQSGELNLAPRRAALPGER